MSAIVDIYTEAVYDNLNPLYANWEPSQPVKLGDYGLLRDRTFTFLGNVDAYGIKVTPREHQTNDNRQFVSDDEVVVSSTAAGSATVAGKGSANASLQVTFGNKDTMFFNIAECTYSMVEDKVALGTAIMALYNGGKGTWDKDWVVITDTISAIATTIAVSSSKNASIILEAAAGVSKIDLANAKMGLDVQYKKSIGYQVVSNNDKAPLTTLIGLCQIQSAFWSPHPKFKPVAMYALGRNALADLESSKAIQTEQSPEALYFGQLK